MKYIKIISLSIIIFFCCLYPVVSAEVNDTGNNTNLTDDNSIYLSDPNGPGKRYPMFKIEGNTTYHVGDDFRFHVTWNPEYRGPIHVKLDDCYETTVTSNTGQFYITIRGVDLSPGLHSFTVQSEADDHWYYDGAGLTILIKE
ncbi:hypothetical protein [Methanobrevibacter sp.]|uniref:hypothetical protein n=1 Tax=Methanobrevibacter sp. TaxID=66852 RepID=UPI00388D9B46